MYIWVCAGCVCGYLVASRQESRNREAEAPASEERVPERSSRERNGAISS